MRLGDEVKSGLTQPNRTEDSQKRRNAITASVPSTKFSLRFQRDAMTAGASASSRAESKSSSAGVTVIYPSPAMCIVHGEAISPLPQGERAQCVIPSPLRGRGWLPERLARRKPGEGVDRFGHRYPTIAMGEDSS